MGPRGGIEACCVILTDREIKIYIQRQLIMVDPEPEDIAYQSTAIDLRLDPTISIFTKPPTVGGVQQITRLTRRTRISRPKKLFEHLLKTRTLTRLTATPLSRAS